MRGLSSRLDFCNTWPASASDKTLPFRHKGLHPSLDVGRAASVSVSVGIVRSFLSLVRCGGSVTPLHSRDNGPSDFRCNSRSCCCAQRNQVARLLWFLPCRLLDALLCELSVVFGVLSRRILAQASANFTKSGHASSVSLWC